MEVETVADVMTAQPLPRCLPQLNLATLHFQGGVGQAFAVGCATDALELTAQLCNLALVMSSSFQYTISSSSLSLPIKKGGSPVWADIDLTSRVVTADTPKKCLSSRNKVIVVHLATLWKWTYPGVSKSKDLLVVEDSAGGTGTNTEISELERWLTLVFFPFTHKNISTLERVACCGYMTKIRNWSQCYATTVTALNLSADYWIRDGKWDSNQMEAQTTVALARWNALGEQLLNVWTNQSKAPSRIGVYRRT